MCKKYIFTILLIAGFLFIAQDNSYAQCPMCKISTESNLSSGGTAGRGMNQGIFYLLLVPYGLVGGLAYLWWRNKKNNPE